MQVGQCAPATSVFGTPGTGAEVIDSPAIFVRQLTDRRQATLRPLPDAPPE